MSRTTDIIEFVYGNRDIFSPLIEYALYCSNEIQPIQKLLPTEYISLVASFEFNKPNLRWRKWKKK